MSACPRSSWGAGKREVPACPSTRASSSLQQGDRRGAGGSFEQPIALAPVLVGATAVTTGGSGVPCGLTAGLAPTPAPAAASSRRWQVGAGGPLRQLGAPSPAPAVVAGG